MDTHAHRQQYRRLTGHPLHDVMASCAKPHDSLPGRAALTAMIREALGEDADERAVTHAYRAAVALAEEYNRDPRGFNRGRVLDAVESTLDHLEQTDRIIARPAAERDDTDYDALADQIAGDAGQVLRGRIGITK